MPVLAMRQGLAKRLALQYRRPGSNDAPWPRRSRPVSFSPATTSLGCDADDERELDAVTLREVVDAGQNRAASGCVKRSLAHRVEHQALQREQLRRCRVSVARVDRLLGRLQGW